MSTQQYIDAFAQYLRNGDSASIEIFCENSSHINRLAVYRNGFYKGCIDALSANFPMCEKKLGAERFREIARLYVDHFPPEQGTLVGYGINFPQFLENLLSDNELNNKESIELAEYQQVTSDSYTTLVNIAQLDYAWLKSLMSADSNGTLTIENVTELLEQGIELTELNVRLNPSVLLVQVYENAFSEWISLKTNNYDDLDEIDNVSFVMLWRIQGAVQARLLTLAEVALMQTLLGKSKPLSEAFEAAITIDENFDVSDAFTACLQNELLEIKIN